MLYENGSSGQCSDQVNFCVIEQIVVLALKSSMWLLLNLKDDISWFNTRSLVALAPKLDLVPSPNTSVDVDMQDLSLDGCLLSVTCLAPILLSDYFTLSVAVWADSLEALNHGTHLAHHGLHAVAIASRTLLDGTFLSTSSIAFGAND